MLLGLFYILFLNTIAGLRGSPYMFYNESIGTPNVSTTSGQFFGLTIRDTNVWIGIPYAAPPVGALRWEKAQPYVMYDDENDTIQNATEYSSSCPQIVRAGSFPNPVDEDCLYLNIWAPRTPSSKSSGYPVLLWFHGGAFIEGSASQPIYDGLSWTNAAIKSNNPFILVSINYRLSVMGFFAQPALLDQNNKTIANQGITDQRMAMKWVQDNIEQFGGDKNSVTIMGESAGSHSVCIHMVSPLSVGLFHAGILDSGTCDTTTFVRDKSFAYTTSNNLASIVGCSTTNSTEQLACLRTINSTVLINVMANVSIPPSTAFAFKDQEKVVASFPFILTLDDVEIPIHPLEVFLAGAANQVPILIGSNHDEFLLRIMYEGYFHSPTSEQDYLTRILPIITYNNSELQAAYMPSKFNSNYSQAYVAFMSQAIFICSARRMAGYMNKQPAYLYTYTHTPESFWLASPDIAIWPGAYHISELFNLFQTLAATLYGDSIFSPDELPLATSIRQYWTNMITKSQPNDNNSTTWPQYSSTNDQALELDKNMTMINYLDIYPNCDLFSAVQVKVFGEYLGFNATCTAGNKCFIINSTTPASSASHNSHYYGFNFGVLLLLSFKLFV